MYLVRKGRLKRKGGGICVYVKHSLRPGTLSESYSLDFTEIFGYVSGFVTTRVSCVLVIIHLSLSTVQWLGSVVLRVSD